MHDHHSHELELSFNARKSLSIHINEATAEELLHLIEHLQERIRRLEETKVDITPIAPVSPPQRDAWRRAA